MSNRYCERLNRLTSVWEPFDLACLKRGDIFCLHEGTDKSSPLIPDNLGRVVLVAKNDAEVLEGGNAGVMVSTEDP